MNHKINFREATFVDLNQIIQIHKDSFPEGIQTYLGNKYLRILYSSLIDSSEINIVCESQGKVIGFSFSPPNKMNWIKLISSFFIFPFCIKKKDFIKILKLIKERFELYFVKSNDQLINNYPKNSIELAYIAISKSFRSLGLGSLMINEFEKKALLNYNKIITRTHNKRLTEFYLKIKKAKIYKLKSNKNAYTCTLIWNLNQYK